MSGFESSQGGGGNRNDRFRGYEIKSPSADARTTVQNVESEGSNGFEVRAYELPDFRRIRNAGYQETRAKYGPLAVTDPDHHPRTQRDARFRLNSLQREPLAVDQEERRVIDELVQERVRDTEIQIREQAHQEGYQAGFQQGHEEAEARVRAEGQALLERLRVFANSCEQAKEDILKSQEKLIVELVLRMGRSILLRELTSDKDYILRLARELISSTDLREHLKLKVSENDLADAARVTGELQKAFPDLKNLRIEPSPLVQQGGAILESQWSTTDAAVETQIQRVFDAVLNEEAAQ
jgi:flagellar assembly protein FliH